MQDKKYQPDYRIHKLFELNVGIMSVVFAQKTVWEYPMNKCK